MRIKNILFEMLFFVLALIWVFTFVSKIIDFETFKRQINGAYLLSDTGSWLPYALQAIHLIMALMLINKMWRIAGLISSSVVLAVYTGYLIYILKFAPSIPCSCIAIFKAMNWHEQLYFNMAVLTINILGLIMFSFKQPPHSDQIRPLTH